MFGDALESLKVKKINSSNENEAIVGSEPSDKSRFVYIFVPPVILDPRPEYPDHKIFEQLLAVAGDIDYRLFGALHCIRSCGTGVVKVNGALRLAPYFDPAGKTAWRSQAEYDREKGEILGQVKGLLVELFGKMVA